MPDTITRITAPEDREQVQAFLTGKSDHTVMLFDHFISEFSAIADIRLYAAKTMIGIGALDKRIAWITQFGKNFIHVVFPFKQLYPDNLCFTKIGQVPGTQQYNHHFRMLQPEDLNEEVKGFMKIASVFKSVSPSDD